MATRRTWLSSFVVKLNSGQSIALPASLWQNVAHHLDVVLVLEFRGAGGSYLQVSADTTPETNVDAATGGGWLVMGTTGMASSPVVLVFKGSAAVAPMGLARLVFSASGGTVTGAVRAFLLLKVPSALTVAGTPSSALLRSMFGTASRGSCCGGPLTGGGR